MSFSFSVVIPVYNRPEELLELLDSIAAQTRSPEEIVIVEDGSTVKSKEVVDSFEGRLTIKYIYQENTGQGFARNTGYKNATGDYFFVFDSDCVLPPTYFEIVEEFLKRNPLDAFGGPDASHPDFTVVQKAISHTMTSFFTTGGMRGGKRRVGSYHPRSFNMAISREVFEKTQGYIIPFMGEDLEFSTRIIKEGFSTGLIQDAFVYHKRRTNLRQFAKQLFYFGRARINLSRFHGDQVKLIHLFPVVFSAGLICAMILSLFSPALGLLAVSLYSLYFLAILLEGVLKFKSLMVGFYSLPATILQMFGYGLGLVYEGFRKWRGIDPNTPYIDLY